MKLFYVLGNLYTFYISKIILFKREGGAIKAFNSGQLRTTSKKFNKLMFECFIKAFTFRKNSLVFFSNFE